MIMSHKVIRMRNASNLVEKIKTHIVFPLTFFPKNWMPEIMWKNTVQPDRPQMSVMLHRKI
jgi:hypothetical protein